jgi:hypothetical protein
VLHSYTKVTEGYYYVRKGDSAQSVAKALYGDVSKSGTLLKANPEEWEAGTFISVPGIQGRVDNMRPGESVVSVIKRMFPGQPVHLYQPRFYLWNGGQNRDIEGGGLVFVPER